MDEDQVRVAAAQALRKAQEEINGAAFSERQKMLSRAAFSKYNALIAAGFTESQAMFLVKDSPI